MRGLEPGDVASRVTAPTDLMPLLAHHPEAATASLVRAFKTRVDRIHREDAHAAHDLAECARIVAERIGDPASVALARRAQALAALAAGYQREVLEHYQAAARLYHLLGDELERARVMRSMVDPLMHLGRYEEALATAAEGRRTFLERGELILAAEVDVNVGNVYHHLDRHADSLDAYDRAIAAFRASGDDAAVATVEFNRAHVSLARGDLEAAALGYEQALAIFRERGWRLRESQCRHALAYLDFLAGRPAEALRRLDEVRALDQELGDERHAALCSLDEAELLLDLNAWEDASERARRARLGLETLGLMQEATFATLIVGLGALHLRSWDEAEARLSEAAEGFARDGNAVLAGLADLYRAELHLRRADEASAHRLAARAAQTFERQGLAAKAAYAHVVAGRALLAAGSVKAARRRVQRALEKVGEAPGRGVRWRVLALLADVTWDPAARRRHLEAAIEDVEAQRSSVLPDELQATFQRDKVGLYGKLARARLDRRGGPADPAGALAAVEAAKSRVLAAWLHRDDVVEAERLPVADRPWRQQLEALNHLYRRLNEAERDPSRQSSTDSLRREIDRRESEIKARFWALQLERADDGDAPSAYPHADGAALVSALAAVLDAGESFIEYAILGDELYAFVLPAGGELTVVGPLASVGAVAEGVEKWVFQAGRTALGSDYLTIHGTTLTAAARAVLKRLHDMVWAPLAPFVGEEGTIVVPAGPLWYVPFHALWDGERYLVEGTTTTHAPGARALLALRRKPRTDTSGTLVMGHAAPGLEGIDREVEAIRRHLPDAIVRTGGRATRATLRDEAAGISIMHLAAHADYRSDSPLLSSIALADGRLTFYDLFDLRLDADLVVLSGCRTAHQTILEGDELFGLARGFQMAGARDLVASLWPVSDEATACFMDDFYARIADGVAPARALTLAMRSLMAQGRPPHEWAPFHLTGAGRGGLR